MYKLSIIRLKILYFNISKDRKIWIKTKNGWSKRKKCALYIAYGNTKKDIWQGNYFFNTKIFFFLFFACSVSALFQLLHIKYTASHCQHKMKKKPRFCLFVFCLIRLFSRFFREIIKYIKIIILFWIISTTRKHH